MSSRGALTIMACESGRKFAERVVHSLNELVRNNYYRSKSYVYQFNTLYSETRMLIC